MKHLLLWCAFGMPAFAQDTGPCDTADTSTPCDTGDTTDTSDCDTADSGSDCDTGTETGDTGDTGDTDDTDDSAYTGVTQGAAELAGELGGCGCNTLELPASAAVLLGLALVVLQRRRSGTGVLSRV